MSEANRRKEAWGSRVGVILAVTGSAVGLGNFLRFPGLAAKYEGGAFMIPYFIAFLLLGLPIAWVEWSMGRYGGARGFNSSPGIYRSIWKNRAAPYFGVLAMLVPVMIYVYYIYIEGWCLAYSVRYLFGRMNFGADPQQYQNFFNSFVGLDSDGGALSMPGEGLLGSAVFFLVVCFIVNFVLIYRGLSKGIEWFCKWAMPALLLCAIIVMVRVLTLGTPDAAKPDQNVVNGLGFMWNPGTESMPFWESLAQPGDVDGGRRTDLLLAVGRLRHHHHLRQLLAQGRRHRVVEPHGGRRQRVLRSRLGRPDHRAGRVRVPRAELSCKQSDSLFQLGFVVLPNVFNQMPAGQLVGFLFFFLLFLAAVTSSLSMLQPAIALLEEGLGLQRKASVALLGFITAVGVGVRRLLLERPVGVGYDRLLDRHVRHLRAGDVPGAAVRLGSGGRSRPGGIAPRRRDPHSLLDEVHHQVRLAGVLAGGFRALDSPRVLRDCPRRPANRRGCNRSTRAPW